MAKYALNIAAVKANGQLNTSFPTFSAQPVSLKNGFTRVSTKEPKRNGGFDRPTGKGTPFANDPMLGDKTNTIIATPTRLA